MNLKKTIIFTLFFLVAVAFGLRLGWIIRRMQRPLQDAPATIVTLPLSPTQRIAYESCFLEQDAETVIVLTLDIPGVMVGWKIELPIRRKGELELSDGGGFHADFDGLRGDGMNASVNIDPDYDHPDIARLTVHIDWDAHGKHGSIHEEVFTPVGAMRLNTFPNSSQIRVEFRTPRRAS
jgi:hypothetical protein